LAHVDLLDLFVLVSVDLDTPRLDLFAAADPDVQHPVAIAGLDLVGIDVLGQCQHALELAAEALAPVIGRAFALLGLALAG
jgi:hypothetical protein